MSITSTAVTPNFETLLVVDDNELVLNAVSAILRHAKFRVISARSGEDAIELVQRTDEPIHLLLSDVDMPKLSGPELGRVLKGMRPDLRVMMMSGGDNGLLVMNYGWSYLQKPFLARRLVTMVKEVLISPDRSQPGGEGYDPRLDIKKL